MLEQRKTQNIAVAVVVLLLLYVISAVFYNHQEGWGYVDCVYFVTMTITTIGYGDVVPHTAEGKIYTIFLAFIGISLAFYIIASLALIRERTVDTHLHRRLGMIREIIKLKRGQLPNEGVKKKLE